MADDIKKFLYLQFEMNVEELSKQLLNEIRQSPLQFGSFSKESPPTVYTFHRGTIPLVKESPISFSMHLLPLPYVNLDYLRSSQLQEIRSLIQKRLIEDIDNLIRKQLLGDETEGEYGR